MAFRDVTVEEAISGSGPRMVVVGQVPADTLHRFA
jgi:hypothetical protein